MCESCKNIKRKQLFVFRYLQQKDRKMERVFIDRYLSGRNLLVYCTLKSELKLLSEASEAQQFKHFYVFQPACSAQCDPAFYTLLLLP